MIYDLQRASVLKRISAFMFDVIMLAVVAVGIAFLLSTVLGYDAQTARLDELYDSYAKEYSVDFDISYEDYEKLSAEEKGRYDEALKALSADNEAVYVYSMIINLTIIIMTFSVLISYLALEFAIPLFFKNGQTLGKKIFGIGLMRTDGVRLSALQLFTRTVLGKCTLETLLPAFLIILVYFNAMGIVATIVIGGIAITQLVLLFVTKNRSQIHDLISGTVAIDMASQLIFETPEALLEYKKKLHEEKAEKSEY